jgi:hypothetical protein
MAFSFAKNLSAGNCKQQPQCAPRGFPLKTKNVLEAAAIIPRLARFGHTKMGARRVETGEPIGGY